MTAADWHASTDPRLMLRHVNGRPTLSRLIRWAFGIPAPLPERPLRQLLAAACDLPPADPAPHRTAVVELIRDHLDGRAESLAALETLLFAFGETRHQHSVAALYDALLWLLVADTPHNPPLADAVRCLFGDPFDPPPDLRPFRTRDVVLVAQAARGDLSQLPVLADALEDAGCGHAGLLAHLRGPWPHRGGCHALTAVLGEPAA